MHLNPFRFSVQTHKQKSFQFPVCKLDNQGGVASWRNWTNLSLGLKASCMTLPPLFVCSHRTTMCIIVDYVGCCDSHCEEQHRFSFSEGHSDDAISDRLVVPRLHRNQPINTVTKNGKIGFFFSIRHLASVQL